jgi:hypothetical protein
MALSGSSTRFPSFFHSKRLSAGRPSAARATTVLVLALSSAPWAQGNLRCDLKLNTTPGSTVETGCLDLVALQAGGTPVQTANNATRISTDGFRLCKNAFAVNVPAGADVVFIYDNSGSMFSRYAKVDSALNDTSYFYEGGCSSPSANTIGPLTYGTLVGPRNVTQLGSLTNCNGFAGDPYHARASVIRQGIEYLRTVSPNSTAGAVAFALNTSHLQPPLPLNIPGNADLVKASVVMDSLPSTNYAPPLQQANAWLNDANIVKTAKKAIVFVSDGEPNNQNYAQHVSTAIPIYTIALADSSMNFPRMRELSTNSGGQFFRVSPDNITQMNEVMRQIIQAITVVNLPSAIEVSNGAYAPPMVSRSAGMNRNADSSISLVMDSIIALKAGANPLTIKVTMTPQDIRTYNVSVQADGPAAPQSTQQLACFPMPTLAMLNQSGGLDSVYPSGTTLYDVRLTRASSDLQQVVVNAKSSDSARPGWGDEENLVLPQTGNSGGLTTNLKDNQAFNGASANPAKGNNILEAGPNGLVTLVWKHPRDEREFATFTLPGKRVPVEPGFIDMIRVTDVPKGIVIDKPITNPIVIRGGVTLGQNGQGATLVHKGILHNPHGITEVQLNPNNTPTFVFKTASAFKYEVSIFDHLGQWLCSQRGDVDSTKWEQMRGGADSLAVAMSILPVAESGQPFATGVYIMKATLTTKAVNRTDPGRPLIVKPATKIAINRFGYRR